MGLGKAACGDVDTSVSIDVINYSRIGLYKLKVIETVNDYTEMPAKVLSSLLMGAMRQLATLFASLCEANKLLFASCCK